MLEQCPTLADCEKALARAVQDVVLLGDLPLTDDDLERLTRLIRVYKQPFQLLRNAPTCLVCLLVFVGRTSYEEGAYWHGVEAHLGPLDGNRQRQLGRFFRRYVRMRGLLLPQVEGGYAYVTPILVHAGIPQHCLPEFFSKVVAPLVTRAGVIAPSEVAVQLNVWRSQAEERARLQQRLDEQIEPQSLLDVEKPIVRYLIYGGSSAERLLTKAVGLFGRCLESGAIDEQLLADLPPYVGRAFRQWWQAPATRTSLHEDSPRDRFRTPAIQLDATAQRVELLLPSQAYTVQEGLPSLLVMDAATARTLVQLPLRSRRRGAQVETEPLTLELETPAEEYQIRLQVDDQTLRQWTLPTRAGALPCRLFAGPRRQLLRDPPPPEPVWILLDPGASLPETLHIIQEGQMVGDWQDHRLLLADLTGQGVLAVTGHSAQLFTVPTRCQPHFDAELIGQRLSVGRHRQGYPLYCGELPRLRITCDADLALADMWLTVAVDGDNGPVRQSRLSDFVVQATRHETKSALTLNIDLGSLYRRPLTGCMRVRLYNTPMGDWHQIFALVPALEAEFDRPVYLPWSGDTPPMATLRLRLPPGVVFTALPPAAVTQDQDGYWVQIDQREESILGELCWQVDTGTARAPVSFDLPKLLWCFSSDIVSQAAGWQMYQRQELWLDDWESLQEQFLLVKLPAEVQGELALGSDAADRQEIRRIVNQIARFDLLAWRDSLRAGKPLKWLRLTHPDPAVQIKDAPICTIRSAWEAQDLACVQMGEGERVILRIGWSERGRAQERVLCIWDQAGRRVLHRSLSSGERTARVETDTTTLPPGAYLIHLAPIDPWWRTLPAYPGPQAPSTIQIEVVGVQQVRQDEVLTVTKVEDEGVILPLAQPYRLRITGRIIGQQAPRELQLDGVVVKRTNAGWFWGELLEEGDDEQRAEARASNPLKFRYALLRPGLSAIEDRNGDGAMYCHKCQRLHWREERVNHPDHAPTLVGPIRRFYLA